MSTILVTGGAGYIGSHVARQLGERGERIVTLDNLSTGFRGAVLHGDFVQGDTGDAALVAKTLAEHGVDTVLHFAAHIQVPESVSNPLKYYRNNTANTRTLLECCVAAAFPFRYVALRYFNVAGADPGGRIGQSTPQATHLVKVACEHVVGKRGQVSIFGTDYDTPDGTCIRDYIHVEDLAAAHLQALDYLRGGGVATVLNCGYARGYSVREVLGEVARAAGTRLAVNEAGRRAGDPPTLVAAARRIRDTLGWRPRHEDLGEIVTSALAWERRLLREPMA